MSHLIRQIRNAAEELAREIDRDGHTRLISRDKLSVAIDAFQSERSDTSRNAESIGCYVDISDQVEELAMLYSRLYPDNDLYPDSGQPMSSISSERAKDSQLETDKLRQVVEITNRLLKAPEP